MEYQKVKEELKLMPKSVTGVIESITKDTTKTGKRVGQPYWKVKLHGLPDLFYVWQWPIIADSNIGQEVDLAIDSSDDGRFQRVVECVPVLRDGDNPKNPIETTAAPARAASDNRHDSRGSGNNQYINRMSALKTAVEFISINCDTASATASLEDAVTVAKRFCDYIEKGE